MPLRRFHDIHHNLTHELTHGELLTLLSLSMMGGYVIQSPISLFINAGILITGITVLGLRYDNTNDED